MKKALFIFIFVSIFSFSSLVGAQTSISTGVVSPVGTKPVIAEEVQSTFTIKVGETYVVKNYLNMEIELEKIISTSVKNVEINVLIPGGCGVNADPRCLGMPEFKQTYTVNEGGSVDALATKITVAYVGSISATFTVGVPKVTDSYVYPSPSSCVTRPACLDSTPKCLMAEPSQGWCEESTSGGQTGVGSPISGTVTSGGAIIVCPNGLTGNDCSTCRDGECSASGTLPVDKGPGTDDKLTPPVLNLPKGQTVVSAEKVEASGEADAYFEVKVEKKARLFFLFPVNPEITYSVDASTGVSEVKSRSWWSFLAW
ncbi:hypothetical protein HZA26_02850 [Candidatus Nomurabacteria bacterium]|nr:hypothetical protein [Candidatus Nomurabacteria bacterium]